MLLHLRLIRRDGIGRIGRVRAPSIAVFSRGREHGRGEFRCAWKRDRGGWIRARAIACVVPARIADECAPSASCRQCGAVCATSFGRNGARSRRSGAGWSAIIARTVGPGADPRRWKSPRRYSCGQDRNV